MAQAIHREARKKQEKCCQRSHDDQGKKEKTDGPDLAIALGGRSPLHFLLRELNLKQFRQIVGIRRLRFGLAVGIWNHRERGAAEVLGVEFSEMINRKRLSAFVTPMAVFIGLLAFNSALKQFGGASWSQSTEYWIYPAQTLICGGLLLAFWKVYPLSVPRGPLLGLTIGALVFVLWIAPQQWLGFAARRDGFNPETFAAGSPLYLVTVGLRFLRLVVVVPLLEEIFWRGFLLRYLIDEKFEEVPLGRFSWLSFTVVVLAFALSHSRPDWPAALATGILYNVVIYRTKSLSTCVLAHAATNLFLGIWIMYTGQWGFW